MTEIPRRPTEMKPETYDRPQTGGPSVDWPEISPKGEIVKNSLPNVRALWAFWAWSSGSTSSKIAFVSTGLRSISTVLACSSIGL